MINILYEDNHLLAVLKPAGMATMGLPEGEETLLTLAKEYIKRKYNKSGEVYLGVVSRLDIPVSGIVLFARTSKAAARLNEQFRNHTVEKIYLAIVEGKIFPDELELVGNISLDKRHRKVKLTCGNNDNHDNKNGNDGKESKLRYRKLEQLGANSLIEVKLLTGRKHQIRVQLAAHGFPILGDIKYGGKRRNMINNNNRNEKSNNDYFTLQKNNGGRIALHAYKLSVNHPITGNRITFETPQPLLLRELPQILSICQNKRTR
ncbi:MAG: RluA family pseudouridine synthase [Planctomycetaceae bacterium]|jgi:23S rRNA pseudouridine1911/1915/1917 synthase|nr:RluA family pseudouridine synthase [Planctomycetaceae bacterium]